MDISSLNKEQKDAVLYNKGPLLILAGAGSGKTRVLTTKVAYLVNVIKVSPYNILAITFTNKAALEMKNRVFKMIGEVANHIQISTFHSFGLKIIRENVKYLGYDYNFVIMDSDDSLMIVKSILKKMNIDPKKFNPRAIKNQISSCKNQLMSPSSYEKYVSNEFDNIVYKVYLEYDLMLKKSNAVDFDDLLILPIKLFREQKEVLNKYQERFQYILIDEYQDTNEAQYILSKMIASKYKNICVVGDSDQSIYSFRGANYQNILNFEKDYSNAKVILLETNYRSTKTILDAANDVIKNNKKRKAKNLRATKDDGKKITYLRTDDEKIEAMTVCTSIKTLIDKEVNLDDIAVLYRTNAQSRNLEEAFLKENIPYRVIGSFYFYSRKEIKDLIAYLRLLYDYKDNVSLLRIINVPKRGIGLKTIQNLTEKADKLGISLYEAIDSGKENDFKKLIIELNALKEKVTLTELVDFVLDKTGMKQELISEKSLDADIRLENLEEFKSITKSFEEKMGLVSLDDFLLEISLVSDISEYKNEKNRVSLMTIHAVKGLEFDYVYIVGLEEGIFPHINSFYDDDQLEEERRLAYVAITRAKKELTLLNARTRLIFGQNQVNVASRFISEINSDLLDSKDKKEIVPKVNTNECFYASDVNYQVGDYVYHDNFGNGKVVEVNNSLVTVAFKLPVGIRKLMKNHKSLRRV